MLKRIKEIKEQVTVERVLIAMIAVFAILIIENNISDAQAYSMMVTFQTLGLIAAITYVVNNIVNTHLAA